MTSTRVPSPPPTQQDGGSTGHGHLGDDPGEHRRLVAPLVALDPDERRQTGVDVDPVGARRAVVGRDEPVRRDTDRPPQVDDEATAIASLSRWNTPASVPPVTITARLRAATSTAARTAGSSSGIELGVEVGGRPDDGEDRRRRR